MPLFSFTAFRVHPMMAGQWLPFSFDLNSKRKRPYRRVWKWPVYRALQGQLHHLVQREPWTNHTHVQHQQEGKKEKGKHQKFHEKGPWLVLKFIALCHKAKCEQVVGWF